MAISPFISEADKYGPRIAKALISAFNSLRTEHSRNDLTKILIESGPEGVLRLYEGIVGPRIAKEIDASINSALATGASITASALPAGILLNADHLFDPFNPLTAQFIKGYKFDLIHQLSSNTIEAMRNSLLDSARDGINPRETARRFKNTIGLTPGQQKHVSNYRSYLETLDPKALQRKLRDGRFDPTIRAAIQNSTPISSEKVDRMVERYEQRYIKHRATMIARTESLRAISIGNDENIRQMIADGAIDEDRVRKFWHFRSSTTTRDAHQLVPGLNPDGRGLDEPFQTPLGPMMYPRDPRGTGANTIQCVCWITYKIVEASEVVS